MATVMASGERSPEPRIPGRTVWTAPPPAPGYQSARWGWSHRARTSSKLIPPSEDRNRACGSTPAYTVPGSSPKANCQARTREASVSSGKAMGAEAGSCQLSPRSSLYQTLGPKWELSAPARTRPLCGSIPTAYTAPMLA